MQGLSNALVDVEERTGETLAEEYASDAGCDDGGSPQLAPFPPHFPGMWGWLCTY